MPDSVPATVPTNEEGGPNVQDVNDAGDCMKAECQDLRDIHNTLMYERLVFIIWKTFHLHFSRSALLSYFELCS